MVSFFLFTQTMASEQTRERELRPMMQIRDNYEKVVLTADRTFENSADEIKVVNLIDWLLDYIYEPLAFAVKNIRRYSLYRQLYLR